VIDFKTITYLSQGNTRQKKAYFCLQELQIFNILKNNKPPLVGTIPIAIDTASSDLDIVCQCENHNVFTDTLKKHFYTQMNFKISSFKTKNGIETTLCNFTYNEFPIEIFAQNIATIDQDAYIHMLIEHKILKVKGEIFQKKIIKLKEQGIKTEPAFAQLLNIKGNSYTELLNFNIENL